MLELPEVLNLFAPARPGAEGKTVASAGHGNSPHKFAFFKPSEQDVGEGPSQRRKVAAVRGDGKYIYFDLEAAALFSIAEMDGRILFTRRGPSCPRSTSFSSGSPTGPLSPRPSASGASSAWRRRPGGPVEDDRPARPRLHAREVRAALRRVPEAEPPIKAFRSSSTAPAFRGFGNGYMQEMLFRAGILPARTVASLDKDERKRLHRAVRDVLAEAPARAAAPTPATSTGGRGST